MRGVLVAAVAVLAALFTLIGHTDKADARVFCYNTNTGRFLHWGPCRRTVPRVYCYNRRTGRFLHWGAC